MQLIWGKNISSDGFISECFQSSSLKKAANNSSTYLTYHANFCCYKIAESVEPLYIGLKVTRFLLLTETRLENKNLEWHN